MRVREPCPRRRMAANPKYSSTGVSTWLIHSAANPKNAPTMGSRALAPYLSRRWPTKIIAVAAVKEPAEYKLEIMDRDHPMSWIIGSTNTEKLKVWPGPDINMERLATGRITQP